MGGGRNPPNKNLSRLISSAFPDHPIKEALFYYPGFLMCHPQHHTYEHSYSHHRQASPLDQDHEQPVPPFVE